MDAALGSRTPESQNGRGTQPQQLKTSGARTQRAAIVHGIFVRQRKGDRLTGAADRSVIDVRARHNSLVAPKAEGEAGQSGGAREGIATLLRVVRRTRNLGVISRDNRLGDEQKRGSGIGNGVNAQGFESATADGIPVGGELPEAIACANGDISDRARMLGGVDVAKVVGARRTLLQVGSEEGGSKGGHGVLERVLLRGWLNCSGLECAHSFSVPREMLTCVTAG